MTSHQQAHAKKAFKMRKALAKENQDGEESGLQYESSSDSEEENEETRAKQVVEDHVHSRDYNDIFPGVFKNQKDIVYGPSVAKLRGDDLNIVEKLVAKYGNDLGKMVRDIKLNYMQWSKSEMKKKHAAFFAHKYV